MRTVLRGARSPGDVAIRDGLIETVGAVPEEPGDQVIRCDGDLVTAGLINTHHHLYQWITRGRCVGCDLFGWLVELYPVWGRLDVEDVRAAAWSARSSRSPAAGGRPPPSSRAATTRSSTRSSAAATAGSACLSRGSMDLAVRAGCRRPGRETSTRSCPRPSP
jgi:hypothetical protein